MKKWIEYNLKNNKIIFLHVCDTPPIISKNNGILLVPSDFSFRGDEYIGSVVERINNSSNIKINLDPTGIHWEEI